MTSVPPNGKEPKSRRHSKKVPAHYKPAVKDENGEAPRTDDRPTPLDLFESFNAELKFRVDVCCSRHNHKVSGFFDEARNGLAQNWARWRDCWCNPPYGDQIPKWIKKALMEAKRGATVAVLVPASTSTHWFRDMVLGKAEIRWIQSKIRFVGQKQGAPFHSMLLVYGPDVKPIHRHYKKSSAVNRFGDTHIIDPDGQKRKISVWRLHDDQGHMLFDPVTSPGSWFNRREQIEMDQQLTAMFFGSRNDSGHYFWPGPPQQTYEKILYPESNKTASLRPIMIYFDGVFYPKTGQGHCSLIYIEQIDTTVLAWMDRSVDKRPGSNSAIIAIGRHCLDDLVTWCLSRYPDVIERQPRPLTVVSQNEYKTLREAIEANHDGGLSLKRQLEDPQSDISLQLAALESED